MKNKFLVIGCGRLGSSIANQASEMGENVIVVDPDPTSFERLDDSFSGYKIVADGTDEQSLEEAYIKTAKEIAITTGDDNVNLFLAHCCSLIYQVPAIYVRFSDPDYSALISGMNVKAIYPFELSLNKFRALEGTDKE
jgi:trk system potassium uptake protein TrkA